MAIRIKTDGEVAGPESPPARRPKQPARRRTMRIRLTAMIDVTFLLLLFFLLTFTFRPAEGQIPGSLPKEGTGPDLPPVDKLEQPIRIRVRPTGPLRQGAVYEADAHPRLIRTPRELGEFLLRRAARTPEAPVLITPRGDVQWRWAVEAFNQAVRAKFKKVSFNSPT